MEYFFSIFFGSFVLEDVALASALALVAGNKMRVLPAFLACSLGIAVGDLGLYWIGLLIAQLDLKKIRSKLIRSDQSDLFSYSIIVSRFIPGTRLPIYLAAGALRYPFWRFFALIVLTVLGWVALAFALGRSLRSLLTHHWLLTVIVVLLILQIMKWWVPKITKHWARR